VSQTQTIFDQDQVGELVSKLAREIAARHPVEDEPALVGIRTGGAHLAWRLREELAGLYGGYFPDTGVIDITLYRDDWTRLHHRPRVGRTEIGFPLEERIVVLIDDVLYTGRTVRAGLDELIDFGRPQRIELAVLIDRGHRELPIQPDYVGAVVETRREEVIDVCLREEGYGSDAVVRRLR
jgi:pyrimidine operon attenuation protein/uracil phosphoribosyltransferase